MRLSTSKFMTISVIILLQQTVVFSKRVCDDQAQGSYHNASEALKYKLIAVASTLVASLIGVCLPILAKNYSYLNPENDLYFLIKAFAAGVILATGIIHLLNDAFEALTSPCIGEKPWGMFPFSGFVAMVAAIGTLIMEALVTGYHKRSELMKAQPLHEDEDTNVAHDSHVHSSALASEGLDSPDLLRHTIVSQVSGHNYVCSLFFFRLCCVWYGIKMRSKILWMNSMWINSMYYKILLPYQIHP